MSCCEVVKVESTKQQLMYFIINTLLILVFLINIGVANLRRLAQDKQQTNKRKKKEKKTNNDNNYTVLILLFLLFKKPNLKSRKYKIGIDIKNTDKYK